MKRKGRLDRLSTKESEVVQPLQRKPFLIRLLNSSAQNSSPKSDSKKESSGNQNREGGRGEGALDSYFFLSCLLRRTGQKKQCLCLPRSAFLPFALASLSLDLTQYLSDPTPSPLSSFLSPFSSVAPFAFMTFCCREGERELWPLVPPSKSSPSLFYGPVKERRRNRIKGKVG